MPHFIIEYSDNLKEEGEIAILMEKINKIFLSYPDLIPIGGIRIRAIELKEYLVADGTKDDGFVHAVLKLGKGRTDEEKKRLGDEIFQVMKAHFKDLFQKRYLALSMEIFEFQRETYKYNNIHRRYQ